MDLEKVIYYIEETNLKKHTFLNEKDMARLKNAKKIQLILKCNGKIREKKNTVYTVFFKDYPEKLKLITDPPYALVRTCIAAG